MSASVDRSVIQWDRVTGRCVLSLTQCHSGYVKAVQFYSHGLASCGGDNVIKMWDLRNGRCVRRIECHSTPVNCLQFDSERLISGGRDGSVVVTDLRTGRLLHDVNNNRPVQCLQFKGNTLIYSTEKNCPVMYDLVAFNELAHFQGHQGNVHGLCFEEDHLFTASSDTTVKLWDFGTLCSA